MRYFLAYDVGTSSVKSILTDETGKIYAAAIEDYPLYMPNPGWVEQDPEDYWNAICKATHRLVQESQIPPQQIEGMVFTTQAMGIIPVNASGKVLHRNISWVDGRAEKQARRVMSWVGGKGVFKSIIGIELTGKDVIPKLMWLRDNNPELYKDTHKFLDVNGYLKYKCTGKMVAEWSGACSYAFNLQKKDWDRPLYKVTGIDMQKLPDLVRSVDVVGTLTAEAARQLGLPETVAVYGGCDDTQSAAVGTTAIGEGQAHIYTGTSAWVGISTERSPKFKNGAVCIQSADPTKNLIVGITEAAGVNTEWFLQQFYAAEKATLSSQELYALLEKDIASVGPGADYLIMTPWFLGERCPVSTTTTRSTIFNLSHQHTRSHVARAHFEGIAYNLRWTIENMEKDFRLKVEELKITGGGTFNATWMQIIADITQRKIITMSQPKNAGALGAAMCALVGSGVYKDFNAIRNMIQPARVFVPNPSTRPVYDALFTGYQALYRSLRTTYAAINSARFENK